MHVVTMTVHGVIDQYSGYGPLLASFLANMLATFGDKGQLVVVMLASKYDAREVFAGAMAAFTLWSLVEVIFGALVLAALPGGMVSFITGFLFITFGLWSLHGAYTGHASDEETAELVSYFPERIHSHLTGHGGVVTSFIFILFAEFGDKTQLLTINLAATFPESPLAVLVGVLVALGIRTGVDAAIGGKVQELVPTRWIQLVAAFTFLAFGLLVFGII